jgi:hypothetical protein
MMCFRGFAGLVDTGDGKGGGRPKATTREDAQKAADDRRKCKLKALTRLTQRQCNHTDRGDRVQALPVKAVSSRENRASDCDDSGESETVVAAGDVLRASAAAYRRTAATAELSALMGQRRSSARTCFNLLNFFRFMKRWVVLDVEIVHLDSTLCTSLTS